MPLSSRRALLSATAVMMLVLAACGSGGTDVDAGVSDAAPADATVDPGRSVEDTAEANLPLLQASGDARDHEVLPVEDGSIASLRSAVDGDRPVLLWFWAPH